MTSQPSQPTSFTFLQEHGYAVLPAVFSESQISALAFELSQSQLKTSRAGARHILSIGAVRKIADDARVLDLARAVLGSRALPFRATLFDKSPSSNWLVAWHQDTALPLTGKVAIPGWGPWSIKDRVNYAHAPREALEEIFALRVHLDDSTSANGPLRVIPNTHRDGVLTDCEVQERASKSMGIECTAARGGVIAMRPLVIHASSKTESDSPRRVLHIEYASPIEVASELRLAVV